MTHPSDINRMVSSFRDIQPRTNTDTFTTRLYLLGYRNHDGSRSDLAIYWSCKRTFDEHEYELARARNFALKALMRRGSENFHIVEGKD